MVRFRTRRKDGVVYPMEEGDGKRGKGGKILGASVAAMLVYSGGGLGTTSLGGVVGGGESAGVSAADSAVVRTVRQNLTASKRAARKGKRKRAWSRLRLRRGPRRPHEAAECAVLSHGGVRDFFLENPCRGLDRVQFPLTDANGGTVVVLVSWVRMPGRRRAREFRELIDVHGTGDIRPVVPGTRFTGHHYDSQRRGSTVVVAEAEPAGGGAPEEVLETVPEVATKLPAPGKG
ncbi:MULTISPECIES: hypothetical protein [unclassified Actinopolyspora]|uniref:hypothetical protein n=1 Tax=unclassified Actinopolyspora TaxID=2639451 RepID=UPI001A983971|nr:MULTISPECIES: hypothetical protein [unclassified Actinopolyspora]